MVRTCLAAWAAVFLLQPQPLWAAEDRQLNKRLTPAEQALAEAFARLLSNAPPSAGIRLVPGADDNTLFEQDGADADNTTPVPEDPVQASAKQDETEANQSAHDDGTHDDKDHAGTPDKDAKPDETPQDPVTLAQSTPGTATIFEIAAQRAALAEAARAAGAGPQSPRDIDSLDGNNLRAFGTAPPVRAMNLCNIHFHESAEHKGGEFTTFVGNGDGRGNGTGFAYDGTLSLDDLEPIDALVGAADRGDLQPGDTIEIHFVYSTAAVSPGPTLEACKSEGIRNPHLRIEAVVAILVNDEAAADLTDMALLAQVDGYYQAPNLPNRLGVPVVYAGSTASPAYNETPSPYQVTWSVRPRVLRLDISSVARWLADNPFDETHAQGVRTLVINPDLLSPITY